MKEETNPSHSPPKVVILIFKLLIHLKHLSNFSSLNPFTCADLIRKMVNDLYFF